MDLCQALHTYTIQVEAKKGFCIDAALAIHKAYGESVTFVLIKPAVRGGNLGKYGNWHVVAKIGNIILDPYADQPVQLQDDYFHTAFGVDVMIYEQDLSQQVLSDMNTFADVFYGAHAYWTKYTYRSNSD